MSSSFPFALLRVKVVPGASRSEIVGWYGDRLKIRIAVPPEQGKANAAVLEVLSIALQLPKDSIDIVSGAHTPRKTIRFRGLSDEELHRILKNHLGE